MSKELTSREIRNEAKAKLIRAMGKKQSNPCLHTERDLVNAQIEYDIAAIKTESEIEKMSGKLALEIRRLSDELINLYE